MLFRSLGLGANTTDVLVISQVVLSFGIPFALVPMLVLTSRRSVMGDLVNRPLTTVLGSLVAAVVIAAALFHDAGRTGVETIEQAHAGFETYLGGFAALAFAVALLASGLSSSSVGTYAGQVVMQGFIQLRIPLYLRRGLTMAPSLIVLGLGANTTDVLVISQVVLSFGIPFALVPLILFTRRRDVMGGLVNRASTTRVAWVVAAVIIALNLALIWLTFT